MGPGKKLHVRVRTILKQLGMQLRIAGTAWMYFTRIPLPSAATKHISHSQHSLEESTRYLPLVGIAIGAIAGLVFISADALFDSKALAILLSMAASVLATGALHEDGLGDFFDAFGGGWWSKERILEIMKDSRIGSFGSLAVVMGLLIKFQCLILVPSNLIPWVLIAAHAFSRYAAGSFIFTSSYVRENDESYFKSMMKSRMETRDFIVMSFFGMVPLLLVGSLLFLLLVPVMWAIRTLFGLWFTRKIGGYTGDCLGATQQVIELSFYMLVIVSLRFAFSIPAA